MVKIEIKIDNSYSRNIGKPINTWLNTSGGVKIEANIRIITKACLRYCFNWLGRIKLNFVKKYIIKGSWNKKPVVKIMVVIVFIKEMKWILFSITLLIAYELKKLREKGTIT